MTVNEAIKLLAYGATYEIKGAYSGKIYHKSYMNSSKNLDRYANMEVTDEPFYVDMRLRGSDNNHWCIPVIGVWMHDYDLCRKCWVNGGERMPEVYRGDRDEENN